MYMDEIVGIETAVDAMNEPYSESIKLMLDRERGKVFIDWYDASQYTGISYKREAIICLATKYRGDDRVFDVDMLRQEADRLCEEWYEGSVTSD